MNGFEASESWSHLTGVMFGLWGDDGSVIDNKNWLLILCFQMLLNKVSNFLEGSKGSMWDSNEEVLSGITVSLFVINMVDAVDENDAKVLFASFILKFEGVETLGNVLFKVGWFLSVFLNDLISSVEHVVLLGVY